ncbi:unnamed protein product [Diabrotica balteata]|uniref:ATP-dependent DNA helicase n=1 Tax=Diabrotica balteata TaxID=107213 RepID=A0A9N9SU09_DIABA|nr:unnamed protein product [Diabrotica balteata]
MAHKKSLEALDRTLQDLRSNYKPFGGAMILLAGDFRQTLPVIPRSTPADEQLFEVLQFVETCQDVAQNYRNHDWLSKRAILAAKNKDANELNFKIQEQITGEMKIYKSVDSATNQDDVINYQPEFLTAEFTRIATSQSTIKGWIGSYNVEKYQPTTSLQRHTVSDKKIIEQRDRSNYTQRKV